MCVCVCVYTFYKMFIHLFIFGCAGLCCCTQAFSSFSKQGLLPWVLIRPLTTHLHPPPQLGVGLGPSSHLQNKSGNSCAASASLGFPGSSVGKDSTCNAGDLGSIPGLGRSPGGGNGCVFQFSCLENCMDRGAWHATVHVITKSWTPLSD